MRLILFKEKGEKKGDDSVFVESVTLVPGIMTTSFALLFLFSFFDWFALRRLLPVCFSSFHIS
jgi:hypothetical protein